jgi:hypothetical protein
MDAFNEVSAALDKREAAHELRELQRDLEDAEFRAARLVSLHHGAKSEEYRKLEQRLTDMRCLVEAQS